MIRFRFELYPLDEVSPWGGDRPTLHWFGLTEGWYWIEVGGHQLLRRSRLDHPYPYVDYYLARLWEDVIVLTPDVLEPVPADLQPSGPAVRVCVPTAAYLEAVHTLDRDLMKAMQHRVEELERRGGLPGVDLDLDGLRREHQDRTHWLCKNLNRTPTTDWHAIRHGADRLLAEPHRASAPTA